MSTLYQRLEIDKTASQAEIRQAYHRLAMKYHPDRNPGDKAAEESFKSVVSAFEILGDPKARALYDLGRINEQGRPQPREQQAFKADWIWEEARNIFDDDALKWSRAARGEAPPEGEEPGRSQGAEREHGEAASHSDKAAGERDEAARTAEREKQYRLAIDFMEACLGTQKHVRLPNKVEYKITIPAGVKSGQKLRVKGAGENGKPFVVKITVEPHRFFEREGDDIMLDVPITPYESYFGVELDIPTIHGPSKITVRPEAMDGETVLLPNMGVRRKGEVSGGDQLVTLKIVMPDSWAAEARFAMTDWRKRAPYNPRRELMALMGS